jgi:hypothetical protein
MVFLPTIGLWPKGGLPAIFDMENISLVLLPILLLLLSVLTNRVFVISDIFSRNTLWPGHAYILILILHLTDTALIPSLVHGLLGILIMYELITIQYNQDARRQCFQIGLYIGLASLLNWSLILLAPILLLGLRNLKPLNIKEYLLYIIALTLPFYFVWSYCFLAGDFTFWSTLFPFHTWFRTPVSFGWYDWTKWFIVVGTPIALLMVILSRYNSLPVRMRRLVSATTYLLVACEVASHAGGLSTDLLYYMAPIFSLYATMFMLRYSNKSTLEIIHLIFVSIIIGVLLTGTI